MENNSVSQTRAGDVFHYRYAARRCLKLIHTNSLIEKICVERSLENDNEGGSVIDISEYSTDDKGIITINYYQLKHTSKDNYKPFNLGDFKKTIKGFSKRYLDLKKNNTIKKNKVSFTIVSNRKISERIKKNVIAIAKNQNVEEKFLNTIQEYTKLDQIDLISFCSALNFDDNQGNYLAQNDELRHEMSSLFAGIVDITEVNNLVELVRDKILPHSDGIIVRENVLHRFGFTSERNLFPAPTNWPKAQNFVKRKVHIDLLRKIECSQDPIIIHASGGVGKTFFCQHILETLKRNDLGIVYDCFGNGSYRNTSETRHSHRVALVQIANELSSKGLCNPILIKDTTSEEEIMKLFLIRIEQSINSLKEIEQSAKLFIIIDAADNSEMAAKEYGQRCFASELIREKMPFDCKLVFLCRTERIQYLKPKSNIILEILDPFSENETLIHMRKWFPNANENDGREFHRLTYGNPRIQRITLESNYSTIEDLLTSLGPFGTSVKDQIESQLNFAISKIKDELPQEYHFQIDSICTGLACLPPHIPIEILSLLTEISVEQIKSFVSDIGKSLWISENSIQFRDEPTEDWFREKFIATKQQYAKYIKHIEPLATNQSYVAEVLPQLYLLAGQYERLIKIALSDDFLPLDNPTDSRNILLYRLKFALKAALKINRTKDAIKLAMRAGEESAGFFRQINLFIENSDLIPVFQSKEKIQELAFKRILNSGWNGSENIYSAFLLSSFKDFQGEARGYLRSALNWINIYFDEKSKSSEKYDYEITNFDVLNLIYTHLNINGVKECFNFLKRISPKNKSYILVQNLTRSLIDHGKFEEINSIIKTFKSEIQLIIAITSELIKVGKFPDKSIIGYCLERLYNNKKCIKIDNHIILPGLISFLETCIYHNLDKDKILNLINYFSPSRATNMLINNHFSEDRIIFLKSLAIKKILNPNKPIEISEILPSNINVKNKDYETINKVSKYKDVINSFLPWYCLRAKILLDNQNQELTINEKQLELKTNINFNYRFPNEIAKIQASILILGNNIEKEKLIDFFNKFLFENKNFRLFDRLQTLRAAYRLPHLECISQKFEIKIYDQIKKLYQASPDEIAEKYLSLSRAVLTNSKQDANVYFNEAVKISSKFGEETIQRWKAISSIANKSCKSTNTSDKLAYRFIRCAELIGETVGNEEYWDRYNAIQICTRMSPSISISMLSRWRDREIGDYELGFESLIVELTKSNLITPSLAWVMSSFCNFQEKDAFLSLCLEKEKSIDVKNKIFFDLFESYRKNGVNNGFWQKLQILSNKYEIKCEELDILTHLYTTTFTNDDNKTPKKVSKEKDTRNKFDYFFEDNEIYTYEKLKDLIKCYNENNSNKSNNKIRELIIYVVSKMKQDNIWKFVDLLFLFDEFNRYDLLYVISNFPESLKESVSFKSNYKKIIYNFGRRFGNELVSDSLNYFIELMNLDDELTNTFKSGILDCFAGSNNFKNSTDFFGFVNIASNKLHNDEATEILDFVLKRLELFIDKDFGDSEWSEEMKISNKDISFSLAGYIWSSLGSPRSEVRWNMAHTVRKLAEFDCLEVINYLMDWFKLEKVNAFGFEKYPFYLLHSKQYLLMALESVSFKKPEILINYKKLFVEKALNFNHLLIQNFSSRIILNIEKKINGSFDKETLNLIEFTGKSQNQIDRKKYNYKKNSYWHKSNQLSSDINYTISLDMGDYWYKPLGEIFGVVQNQIEDIARDIIYNFLNYKENNGYYNDPRFELWDNSYNERETYFYKSSYPSTDNLDFYLQYHAMLIVASKLIQKMPIVIKHDWIDSPWEDWIKNHMLIKQNGKWLSDYKSFLPISRPKWIMSDDSKKTINEIKDEDYIFYLLKNEKEKKWLTIKGGIHEINENLYEYFTVTSSLVSTKTSNSLLRALSSCSDHMNYKLPDLGEKNCEIDSKLFKLKGWVNNTSDTKGIEELDPNNEGIYPNPFSIDEDILSKFNAIKDIQNETWVDNKTSEILIQSKSWNSRIKDSNNESVQNGQALLTDLCFVKKICKSLNLEVIFEVSISREVKNKYASENIEQKMKQYKIFILSADGELRSTESNYKLG